MTAAQLLEKIPVQPSAQQQVYVSQLSGGERRRLYLLTVLMKNPNFLILDEPTNDLDVMTLQVLEDFLEDYPGCLDRGHPRPVLHGPTRGSPVRF